MLTAALVAGFETTASSLAFAVYNLAKQPDKARKLEAEVDALKGALHCLTSCTVYLLLHCTCLPSSPTRRSSWRPRSTL